MHYLCRASFVGTPTCPINITIGPFVRLIPSIYSEAKEYFCQPPIVQVLPLKKMREACSFHHMYTSTMTDKMRKENPENLIEGFLMNLFANYGGK